MNYEDIKWNLERVSNIKPFINRYNWERIGYPSKTDEWKTFERNNSTIALNILFIKEKEILPASISKLNPLKTFLFFKQKNSLTDSWKSVLKQIYLWSCNGNKKEWNLRIKSIYEVR